MTFFYILIAALVGFLTGLRISVHNKKSPEVRMPEHLSTPPPKPKLICKEGHMSPAHHAYKSTTFVDTNKCTNCGAVGHKYDIHEVNPCPHCGAKVINNGAAKWDSIDGVKQWIKSEV